ncbi:S-adenosylmethionine mitochondrial carrier protein isoform X1 [Sceloporus undulatus]|uniref:S-adenosylmethionine mitochondrial carrier protein isoform X1 n=1 Tax=Sceloporus undulatus TaxID=8520 RepID=UPI001C4D7BA4|nr:S-adenosylmethionine mitochondrial carrier protein isoform X1 [Sceloporus undulatus]
MDRGEFLVSLTAGGLAGVCVDLILFPLDTVKTRLQSLQGFKKAGGFRGIYAGVPSAAVGSFPNAAAFFVTYEYTKSLLHTNGSPYLRPITHMLAASFGEVVACLIRVPSEVVKQRAQVSPSSSTLRILSNTLYEEGILGLYRGYKSTVIREIPFSLVQFPLWESLKEQDNKNARKCKEDAREESNVFELFVHLEKYVLSYSHILRQGILGGGFEFLPLKYSLLHLDFWSWKQGHVVDSWQSAVCGAFAGGFAAAVTTPLDVAKTRIMLAKTGSRNASGNVLSVLHGVWRTQGIPGLFAGIVPRMSAISLGGFIFLGMYDKIRSLLL